MRPPPRPPRIACALGLLALALLVASARPARAEDDPLAAAQSLAEVGKALIEAGDDLGDDARIRKGLLKLREARKRFEALLKAPDLGEVEANRIRAWLVDLESRIDWYAPQSAPDAAPARPGGFSGEVRTPPLREGERIGPWCQRVERVYRAADDPLGRASLARGLASRGGVNALPTLYRLFASEQDHTARVGIHEALASIGTYRVAAEMKRHARASRRERWDDALDVVYRCLEKPEKSEPERHHVRVIRAFHELGVRKLSLRIVEHLDAMGPSGVAALGEILYVKDIGYHDHVIGLLAAKRDRRAVPPLVHKMNRFKFEGSVKHAAHRALLKMGWYAVPELVERLDDKAAGIWISWTLRKITGETMGTDRRKWRNWWKNEKVRHPELFEDPDERPGARRDPVVTGGK